MIPLLAVFVILTIALIYIIPPFENSDEFEHISFISHLIRFKSLPCVNIDDTACRQIGYHPPLYYVLSVPFAVFSKFTFVPEEPLRDPEFNCSPQPPCRGRHRMYLAIDKNSSVLAKKTAQACVSLRWVSLLWGVGAVLVAAELLWLLSRKSLYLSSAALAIFMFNPRWIEACASVSNDAAATFMGCLILLVIIKMIINESLYERRSVIYLGLLSSLAILTKLSLIGSLLLVPLVLLIGYGKHSVDMRRRLLACIIFVITALIPCSIWFLRNDLLYGSFSSFQPEIWSTFVHLREQPFGLFNFRIEDLRSFIYSYWAVFGQFGVLAHAWFYTALEIFLLIAAVSGLYFIILQLKRSPDFKTRMVLLVTLSWLMIVFAFFLQFNRYVYAAQGRLIYPAGICLAYYTAGGLFSFVREKGQKYLAFACILVTCSLAFYAVFLVILRAYSC